MTLDDLRALADKFFEWPEGSGRQTVTTFSALLFAQHVLQLREKSLGTENSAGVDALRDAAQRQLDALGGYRREIGLLTGVPDEQPCDAEIALRAALEQDELEGLVCARCGALAFDPVVPQQAEPVPAGYLVSPHGEFKPNFNLRFTFPPESLDWSIPLYTAPPQRKPLTDDEILEMVRAAPDLGSAEDEWLHVARAIERAHGIGEEE